MLDQTQMKQLIWAAGQAWYACLRQTCLICGCLNEQNIAHQTCEQKKCFTFLIECLMAFKFYQTQPNTIQHDLTQSNTIKQHQTRCPNGKMFVHQTMFDGVWSPNISRLSRPLGLNTIYRLFIVLSSTAEPKEPNEPLNLVYLRYSIR